MSDTKLTTAETIKLLQNDAFLVRSQGGGVQLSDDLLSGAALIEQLEAENVKLREAMALAIYVFDGCVVPLKVFDAAVRAEVLAAEVDVRAMTGNKEGSSGD